MRAKLSAMLNRMKPRGRRSEYETAAEVSCQSRGIRRRLLERLLRPIAPALIGDEASLPEVDPDQAAYGAAEMICGGPLEVFLTVISGVITLNVLSIFKKGRFLKSLGPDAQADVLARAFNSRLFLLRGAFVIVGLPLKVSYYNGEDVCRELGYDRGLLIEDALKHQVTRG